MFSGMNDRDRKSLIWAGICVGVTGGVYLFMRYALIFVMPILIGLLITLLIAPCVRFLYRKFHMPRILSTVLLLCVLILILALILWYVGGQFVKELSKLMVNYDWYCGCVLGNVCDWCENVDQTLGLQEGKSYEVVMNNVANMTQDFERNFVPSLMAKSAGMVEQLVSVGGGILIALTAVFFLIRDIDYLEDWAKNGPQSKWVRLLFGRLYHFGTTYLRTQLILIGITAVLCTMALFIIGNGYPILIGIGIGFLDALPLFGTGTVLIPWTLLYIFSKKFYKAAVLFTVYCVCYIIREVLEPKMMGGKLGIPPFVMLITMYLGIVIYGLMGFILGPATYIVICEIMRYVNKVL